MRMMEELARNKRPACQFWKSLSFAGIRVIRGRFRRLGDRIQNGLWVSIAIKPLGVLGDLSREI